MDKGKEKEEEGSKFRKINTETTAKISKVVKNILIIKEAFTEEEKNITELEKTIGKINLIIAELLDDVERIYIIG